MPKEGNPLSHPDVIRAAAIVGNAKYEAAKLIKGKGKKAEAKRANLTSELIDDLTRRNGLNIESGQSQTNREIPKDQEATL